MIKNSNNAVRLSPEYIMGGFTTVDNIFICEYMRKADVNDTKIYLYALYLAHMGIPSDITAFTSYLDIKEEEVLKSFEYWQDVGLVDVHCTDPLDVVFHPISNSVVKPRKIKPGKYDDFNKQLQHMLSGRMLSPNEFIEYYNVIELFHMTPEALLLIISYCVKIKGNNIGVRYITQTAKNFAYKKLLTMKAVERELDEYSLQTGDISDVMKKLGVKKKVEIEDNEFYKKWISMGFDKNGILSAASTCKGVGGTVKKLDSVILELYQYKKFSEKEILDFAKSKLEVRGLAIEINKALSIYLQSLDAEINTYILKWLGLGFSNEMLVKIADFCFQNELRTLNDMNDVVHKFAKLGIITIEDFGGYIEVLSSRDENIKKLFEKLGLSRRINGYDRKFFGKFEDLGFTLEMILLAGELSSNANSPYPYMLSILTSWKNNNIYTVDKAKEKAGSVSTASKPKKNDMVEHNYSKEQLNAVMTSIEDLDIK